MLVLSAHRDLKVKMKTARRLQGFSLVYLPFASLQLLISSATLKLSVNIRMVNLLSSACAGYDWKSVRLLFTHFWHRLVGTCGIWFCNDWYFYGNGVFRSTIVELLVGSNASVQINWLYELIDAGVQVSCCGSLSALLCAHQQRLAPAA